MKKVITWVAILLVAFVPTYLIIFGGIKTAVPEVTLADEQLHPAMVQWVTEDENGNSEATSPLQPVMDFLFRHNDPIRLATLDDMARITMELAPTLAVVELYDLKAEAGTPPTTMSWEELCTNGAPVVAHPTQAVLAVEWRITDSIRIQAIYSFEVQPA